MFKEDEETRSNPPAQPERKERKKISFSDGLDITVIILVAVLFVAVILSFLAEFVFDAGIDWKGAGLDTGIVAACTIAIYMLLRSFAQRRGRRTERWTEAQEKLNDKGAEVLEKNCVQYIPKYCRQWEQNHLDDERTLLLERVGIPLKKYKAEYCSLSKKEILARADLTEQQKKVLDRVRRLRTVRYNETYLYVYRQQHKHASPSGGFSTRTVNILTYVRIAITTTLTSLFTASILQEVIFNPSRETVIKLFVKLAVIITFAAIGMVGGYTFSTTREVNEMNAKSDELEAFIKWCADGKYKENSTEKPIPEKEDLTEEKVADEKPPDEPQNEQENNN